MIATIQMKRFELRKAKELVWGLPSKELGGNVESGSLALSVLLFHTHWRIKDRVTDLWLLRRLH